MSILFTAILYIDVLLAIVSFIFAFILLSRRKDQIYFNFGMATLCLGIWMGVTLVDYFRLTPFSSNFHARLGFLMGAWVLHFFTIFTYYFPFKKPGNFIHVFLLYITTGILSMLVFAPSFLVNASTDFPFRYRTVDPLWLTIYNAYFFLLVIISFRNLFISYEGSDGIFKVNLKKIIFGTSIAVLANIVFSLVNFYYTSFDLTHVGMFFTFTVLIYIYNLIV